MLIYVNKAQREIDAVHENAVLVREKFDARREAGQANGNVLWTRACRDSLIASR